MRENLRKWCVLGALASAAWVFPGCKSDSRDTDSQAGLERPNPTVGESMTREGTGGSAPVIMEDSEAGVGGSGQMKQAIPGIKRMDGGMSMDSVTGGSGFDPSAVPNTVPYNMR